MIIDTHCHLDFEHFDHDRDAVIARAKEAGVSGLINIGSSLKGSEKSVELAGSHENIFASVGIHPHDAGEMTDEVFARIKGLAGSPKVVGIGEVGLDYFKSPTPREKQRDVFAQFISLSRETGLPLIIHNRDAGEDTIEILKKECAFPVKGVMHCFSGDKDFLKNALDIGLFISFTCNLTFKNAKNLRDTARHVPTGRFLLETDAPFLAPQKYRGKRNEPAYITELRDIVAGILGISAPDVERITTDNAKKLFGINV